MAKDPKAFLKINRKDAPYRPVEERVKDYEEVAILKDIKDTEQQALRCMDCGTPFCHWACPLGNYIPEWNDFLKDGNEADAFLLLSATNNLPEITGRVCPALCESGCVLGVNDDPITIRENELSIIEYAFENGLVKPRKPKQRTGKKVAIIGSGPAGLACAAQLNTAGHSVVVYERDDEIGGLMRYGIPDFKLKKSVLDRRIEVWKKEGIKFKAGVNVGVDISVKDLLKEYDVICLAGGAKQPRDLKIPGRQLNGIHFAMEYLTQINRKVAGKKLNGKGINAKGKDVVVIGGGDTGSDCVGSANRQGARQIIQIEVLPKPPAERTDNEPWPLYPRLLKTTSSHKEGCERMWSVLSKEFISDDKGNVKAIKCVKVEWGKGADGRWNMKEIAGSEFEIKAQLVLLAIGFLGPEKNGLLEELGVELDDRGNVKTDESYQSSVKNVFSAGDMRRGQSLIVWAISEGRRAAYSIDKFLMGQSYLPKV